MFTSDKYNPFCVKCYEEGHITMATVVDHIKPHRGDKKLYISYGKCEMHITTPKTESGKRIVPMFAAVRKALLQERQQQMKCGFNTTIIDGYSGFVFTNRCGHVNNPQTINRAIKRIYTACNEQEKIQAKKEHRQPVLIPHFSQIVRAYHQKWWYAFL